MANKPTHETHGSVLDDLGFSSGLAAALKFKAELYQAILKVAKRHSQKELQGILGEPQSRVRELLNGKIATKSVDILLYYAGRLGIETTTIVQPAASTQNSEPILTIHQVAERLQLKPSTVYDLTRRRNKRPMPVLRAGKFLRFRWSQIEAWLAEGR